MHKTDIAIIGAGPAGLFTAFQAGMLGMKSIIVDILDEAGGQCSALYPEKPIYDIPACPKILAADLIDKLVEQAKPFDPTYFLSQQVTGLKTLSDGAYEIITSKGFVIQAKAVVIAAGAGAFGPNKPPISNIESYEGISVFYYVKKRSDFKGKRILIAGGGDSALDWAISLSEIAEVSLVHRRSKFRGTPSSVQKIHELAKNNQINLITNYQLSDLKGNNGILEEVVLQDLDKKEMNIKADILLPFFGLAQNLGSILDFGLNIHNHHINVSMPYYETNIKGVYAIGDIATYKGKLKLILTSFAESASALHHAYERVFDGKKLHFVYSTVKGVD